MKVYVEPNGFNSAYFEVDDDITEDEANEIAGILVRADGKPMPWEE